MKFNDRDSRGMNLWHKGRTRRFVSSTSGQHRTITVKLCKLMRHRVDCESAVSPVSRLFESVFRSYTFRFPAGGFLVRHRRGFTARFQLESDEESTERGEVWGFRSRSGRFRRELGIDLFVMTTHDHLLSLQISLRPVRRYW